jgi:hypothetical protein
MMVVMVLAAVVMTGLVVFYLNSQTLWLEGSAQAITQREISLALRTIARRARVAMAATSSGDPLVDRQIRLDMPVPGGGLPDPDSTYCFWLSPADSMLHSGYLYGTDPARRDLGPVIQSRVTLFAVTNDQYMVYVDSLRALTPQNISITMSSSTALMNRP